MRAARLTNGIVTDLWEVPSLDAYTSAGITLVAAPDEVVIGWAYNGVGFIKPEPTADEAESAKQAAVAASKRAGIEILGVLCSATKDDQNGLTAIATGVTLARAASSTFADTAFQFSNGNSLTITDANFNSIYAAWVPFRQSFFSA